MTSTDDPDSVPFPENAEKILMAGLMIIADIGFRKWVDDYGFPEEFIVRFRNGLMIISKTNDMENMKEFIGIFEVSVKITDKSQYSACITNILSLLAKEIDTVATLEEVRSFWTNLSRCFSRRTK
jgi:hypothetical protein